MGLFFPNIAYASVDSFVANVNKLIINPLIGLLFAAALAVFLYGVVEYLANRDNNEQKRSEGRQHMLWGIIGMTVMFGVFFFMNLIIDTLDLKNRGYNEIDPKKGRVDLDEYVPNYPPGN